MKQVVIRLGQQAAIPLATSTIDRFGAVTEIVIPSLIILNSAALLQERDAGAKKSTRNKILPESALRLLFYWGCRQGLSQKPLRELWSVR